MYDVNNAADYVQGPVLHAAKTRESPRCRVAHDRSQRVETYNSIALKTSQRTAVSVPITAHEIGRIRNTMHPRKLRPVDAGAPDHSD